MNVMKNIIIIVPFFLLMASCATRHEVHIFNKGYSSEEIGEVAHTLNELGFSVRPNDLDIPKQISRTAIIYPPIVQDFASIETVRNSLSKIGISNVDLIYETQGEHFYSTENIGLYLVNPDYVEPQEQEKGLSPAQNLSRTYYSNCDDLEAQLNLFPAGAAILQVFEWNDTENRERTYVLDGEWDTSENRLAFELFSGGTIEYVVSEFIGRDDYGRFYGIDLESDENTSELQPCDFRYITYDSRETLNSI